MQTRNIILIGLVILAVLAIALTVNKEAHAQDFGSFLGQGMAANAAVRIDELEEKVKALESRLEVLEKKNGIKVQHEQD